MVYNLLHETVYVLGLFKTLTNKSTLQNAGTPQKSYEVSSESNAHGKITSI
jgi:hypothetical protein